MSRSTATDGAAAGSAANPALGQTPTPPREGLEVAHVELTYQRLPGVARTEPTYELVCAHGTATPRWCACTTTRGLTYAALLEVFWNKIDPTALNRQGEASGRSTGRGIYYYTAEQEEGEDSLVEEQKKWEDPIVTEILPARRFYPAEEYHQRYLEKGGHGRPAVSVRRLGR
ncbi:hypothetical protein HU200_005708 [Digitaria exilis]|uniref:peptide-methionine (S)-S-oxide reductase n=1 Tax=Digitaria exilis TaxID=1010633 RepID=A0A835KSG2_9POAL|nr:hypothetical protein HU200_005708 [Digitaria exilis]